MLPDDRSPRDDRYWWVTLATVFVLPTAALVAIPAGYVAWRREAALLPCDDAIRRTLKAPSTYHRISVIGDGDSITMEYDADNAFGVPIRGSGWCTLRKDGTASWDEVPELR